MPSLRTADPRKVFERSLRAAFFGHFKQATGQTPTDYLTDWRISIRKSMLIDGQALKPIAHAVGYGSPAALIRVFKRKV